MHLKLHCFFLKRFEQHHRISHNFLSVNAKPAHNLILNGWGGGRGTNCQPVECKTSPCLGCTGPLRRALCHSLSWRAVRKRYFPFVLATTDLDPRRQPVVKRLPAG